MSGSRAAGSRSVNGWPATVSPPPRASAPPPRAVHADGAVADRCPPPALLASPEMQVASRPPRPAPALVTHQVPNRSHRSVCAHTPRPRGRAGLRICYAVVPLYPVCPSTPAPHLFTSLTLHIQKPLCETLFIAGLHCSVILIGPPAMRPPPLATVSVWCCRQSYLSESVPIVAEMCAALLTC